MGSDSQASKYPHMQEFIEALDEAVRVYEGQAAVTVITVEAVRESVMDDSFDVSLHVIRGNPEIHRGAG